MIKGKETSALDYSGEATIRVKKGKTTIRTTTAHNSGRKNLFKFLAEALTGALDKSLLPKTIRLYRHLPTDDSEKPETESTWNLTEGAAVCPYVLVGAAGVAESSDDEAEASLTFRIPGSMLAGDFCKLALFPPNASGETDAIAVIGLTKTEDNAIVWDPVSVGSRGDQSLEIEWTLTIKNGSAD